MSELPNQSTTPASPKMSPNNPSDESISNDILKEAKDLFSQGSRNYLVKNFSEAAEDLSKVCALYANIYGQLSNELGMPYLLYAKSLIALAQEGENQLLEVPDNNGESDDDDEIDDDDEVTGSESGYDVSNNIPSKCDEELTNSMHDSTTTATQIQNCQSDNEFDEHSTEANLQLAWEILELAVKIFQGQGDNAHTNLADAYFELAEISFENVHYDVAIRDYKNALALQLQMVNKSLRTIAEIQYKIALSQMALGDFDESIMSFREACTVLDEEIARIIQINSDIGSGKSGLVGSSTIKTELEKLKSEIMNKIIEIEDAKDKSVSEVKKIISSIVSDPTKSSMSENNSMESATCKNGLNSSTEANDISHLVKRKKNNTEQDHDEAPAKKSSMQ